MARTITLNSADTAVEAGKAKAAQLGIASTNTVVDVGAHLAAVCRMDGAAHDNEVAEAVEAPLALAPGNRS